MGTALHMDLILSCILPKLPAKSLIRFKCVCKSFLAEISSAKFINQHHRNALSSDSDRLLILPIKNQGIYVYDLDSSDPRPSFCQYPEVTFYAPFMSVVAICDSYVLIGCGFTQLCDLLLLNPSTRIYRELPYEHIPCVSTNVLYGMWHCLDELKDDYKIVRFVDFDGIDGFELEVMVYNMTTNIWKLIESKTVFDTFISWYDNTPVLVQNHLLHLLFFDFGHGLGHDHLKRIGCFDMKAERWANDVQLPQVLLGGLNFSFRKPYILGALDDQLCFIGRDFNESSYDLWVMKEYGVKESWVKLMTLRVSDNGESPRFWQEIYRPLAYRKGSQHELLYIQGRRDHDFYWYNLRDKEGIEAEFARPIDREHFDDPIAYICKGSLLNFPGGQPIKVSLEDDEDEEEEDNDDEDFVISYDSTPT